MKNSKIVDILKTFDQGLLNHFQQYLNIYRQKRDNVTLRLFDIIYNNFPDFESQALTKEAIHSNLFPSKTFDEKRVLNAMSDLFKLVEEFIAYISARNNVLEAKLYLLQYYLEYDLNKLFESTFKDANDILTETPEDTYTIIVAYRLAILQVAYQLKYDKRNSHYERSYTALVNLIESQRNKLQNLFLINQQQEISGEIILNQLAMLHISLHQMLIDIEGTASYYHVKQKLLNMKWKIAKDELVVAVVIIINYCIEKVNLKETTFHEELIFWYDFMIENECVLEVNGTISSAIVKNYITISLKLGLFQKADTFLERFEPYLVLSEKEDIYNYNKANILFHQDKYEEALVLLATIKYKDVFYKLSAKRLYIKIYFSLCKKDGRKYFEVLDSALNAFKKYIYTTKEVNESVRLRNKSFYKYTSKLNVLNYPDKPKLMALKNELLEDKQCADWDWILATITNKISTTKYTK